jgi:hypothetical protein
MPRSRCTALSLCRPVVASFSFSREMVFEILEETSGFGSVKFSEGEKGAYDI